MQLKKNNLPYKFPKNRKKDLSECRQFEEANFFRFGKWNIFRKLIFLPAVFILMLNSSCKKMVQIDPPVNTITTSEVFADSVDALSALIGVYNNMINKTGPTFGNGAISIYCGSSADELLPYSSGRDPIQLRTNDVSYDNSYTTIFWTQAYPILYQVNAIINGVQVSTGISQTCKNQFLGEAKFFRAFIDFYLVNLYGDIPLLSSTDYKSNSLSFRSSKMQVYDSILADLKDAQQLLLGDYSAGDGERIRVNKWAATALLARVYLYLGDWNDAITQASGVIDNNSLYKLDNNLNDIFLKNSTEAILQWQINSALNTSNRNATPEGYKLIPLNASRQPFYYLSNQLLSAFEPGDNRKTAWLSKTTYRGTQYYYPYKYKVGPAQAVANGTVTEYYMVLRLAEQYLIKAEAEANGAGGGLSAAIADLNIIRNRAGLPNYSGSTTDKTAVLNAIYHERQIELFAEWGHRWFDLKRTGNAHDVLSGINYKQPWQGDYQLLYPIPPSELQTDPNLTQNMGY